MTKPTIGRTVLFVLTSALANAINEKRVAWRNSETYPKSEPAHPGSQMHQGNHCYEGEIYPAVIVKVWEAEKPSVNLQVLLDGSDSYWATSVYESSDHIPGTWHWPTREESTREIPTSGTVGEVGEAKSPIFDESRFIPGEHDPVRKESGPIENTVIPPTEKETGIGDPEPPSHATATDDFPSPEVQTPPVADVSPSVADAPPADSPVTSDSH